MKDILVRFDEFGTTVVEYGLIAFLISVVIVGALAVLSTGTGWVQS
jgi:Flp pilus assembly pilin Flp